MLCLMSCSAKPVPPPPEGLIHRTGLANNHVATCDDATICGDGQEPPVGGPHCAAPLACRVYTAAQNRCEWVHNLEHGHMVLAYNCPSGCDDVVAALQAFYDGLPAPKRALITPDPKLQTKVAAMVWGYAWTGDAVDAAKLQLVRDQQDLEAPEAGLGCQ